MTTIYLSNFASHRTPGAHGPGRKFTIMARPRSWEWGDGRVEDLAPLGDLEPMMIAALAERAGGLVGGPEMAAYRGAFEASLARLDMRPGYLGPIARSRRPSTCSTATRSVVPARLLRRGLEGVTGRGWLPLSGPMAGASCSTACREAPHDFPAHNPAHLGHSPTEDPMYNIPEPQPTLDIGALALTFEPEVLRSVADGVAVNAPDVVPMRALQTFWAEVERNLPPAYTLGPVYRDGGRARAIVRRG